MGGGGSEGILQPLTTALKVLSKERERERKLNKADSIASVSTRTHPGS